MTLQIALLAHPESVQGQPRQLPRVGGGSYLRSSSVGQIFVNLHNLGLVCSLPDLYHTLPRFKPAQRLASSITVHLRTRARSWHAWVDRLDQRTHVQTVIGNDGQWED